MTLIDALTQLAEHYDVIPDDILVELTEMFDTCEEVILALWGS